MHSEGHLARGGAVNVEAQTDVLLPSHNVEWRFLTAVGVNQFNESINNLRVLVAHL